MEDKNDINSLKIDIQYILRYLYTKGVTEEDKENLYKYMDNLTYEELLIFKKIVEDMKYYKKYKGLDKYRVSKNAINLCLKIYKDVELKTVPYIERIACKGWDMSGGTYAFEMILLEKETNYIYSYYRVSECLKKKNIIDFDIDDMDTIITFKGGKK